MSRIVRMSATVAVLLALGVAATGASAAPPPLAAARPLPPLPATGIASGLSTDEIRRLVGQAYFWGMQQVGFYELRYVFTQAQQLPAYRGMNRLEQNRRLFTAKERFATTPNASTLYSGGFFDLSTQPVVVSMPRVDAGRYWSIQAFDQYADYFFVVGSQFTGSEPQRYVIVGPHWKGALPAGFRGTQVVRAPSDSFVVTLRIAVTTRSDEDFASAWQVMDGLAIVPLDTWLASNGKPPPLAQLPKLPGNARTVPRMAQIPDIAARMTGADYLQLLSLVINDPTLTKQADSAKEAATLRALQPLGLTEGALFDPVRMTPAQRDAVQAGFEQARAAARRAFSASQIDMNGWKLQSSLFYDSNDYGVRAGAGDIAWGSPVPYQSHTIAYAMADADGKPLDGVHRYSITFDMNDLPPVTEFWELPVYDNNGYFVDNPIDRYSVTSYQVAARQFVIEDGKLTLYLQNERPTDPRKARNWLPVPAHGAFRLAARFYGPTAPLIDGTYRMPAIEPEND